MHEVIIKYKSPNVLEALQVFSKYLNFSIEYPEIKKAKKTDFVNGVPYLSGDKSIDISELSQIFSEENFDAKQLRAKGWQRRK